MRPVPKPYFNGLEDSSLFDKKDIFSSREREKGYEYKVNTSFRLKSIQSLISQCLYDVYIYSNYTSLNQIPRIFDLERRKAPRELLFLLHTFLL